MIAKFYMTSLLAFFSNQMQLPAALVFMGLYIILALLLPPYLRKGDDRLHLFAQCLVMLLCLCAYVLSDVDSTAEALDDRFVVVVVACFIYIVVFVYVFVCVGVCALSFVFVFVSLCVVL